jgi:DNA-binding MarR family transcriptional regulator
MNEQNMTSAQQIITELYKAKKPSEKNGMTFTELENSIDRAKSTISEQLSKLKEDGVISQDNKTKKYYLKKDTANKGDILRSLVEEETKTLLNLIEDLKMKRDILKPTLTRLESKNYIQEKDERFRLTGRGFAEIGHCIGCRNPVEDDGLVVKATWRDELGEFSVKIHPNCEAESLAGWCQAAGLPSNEDDFCSHCGLPLSPEALENMPEGFASRLTDIETDFDSWKDLFGPINTAYQQIIDTGESFDINHAFEAREFFVSYQENQKQYHPYCYKLQKEV